MTRWAITDYTATTALGSGRAAMLQALREGRSGLAHTTFETARLDSWIGQAPGLQGAVYGLVLYGVYDFTNRAILEKWSLRLALADVAWGMVLNGTMTAALHWLAPGTRN